MICSCTNRMIIFNHATQLSINIVANGYNKGMNKPSLHNKWRYSNLYLPTLKIYMDEA